MKKILTTLLLVVAFTSSTYAGGFTQLELAELLVNKAVAEGLIENLDYSDDEIIDMVMKYDFMSITDANSEMDVKEVRSVLGDYDVKKNNIPSNGLKTKEENYDNYDVEYQALLKEDRKLSHEFMEKLSEDEALDEMYDGTLDGIGSVEGHKFHYEDYDYPLIDNYCYELYRILGWYAKEYDLYVNKSPVSVALYSRFSDYQLQSSPLIEVGFMEHPTDDNGDGVTYPVRIKTHALYSIKQIESESLAEGRKRIESIGFKQAHLVMALRDVSNVFIKEEEELNAFHKAFVEDVIENQDKEYSYRKRSHEVFGDTRYYITKKQGRVFYYINHDLSKWED
jgi:hypothetical protein